jgi:hypothetical protein
MFPFKVIPSFLFARERIKGYTSSKTGTLPPTRPVLPP